MKSIVIVAGVRTPIGVLGGALKDLTAQRLAELTTKELIRRTNLDVKEVDEVIFGCCVQSSDAPNIARVIALKSGIQIKTPAYTVMRNCASGIQAIVSACQNILSGDADLQIVGGTESMSNAPYIIREMRFGKRLRNSEVIDTLWEGLTDPVCGQIMGLTAENLAEEFKISRDEQDKYAIESHRKAFRAIREGKFKDEIIPVEVAKFIAGKQVGVEIVNQDEGPNVGLSLAQLALYPVIFKENGTVTSANSCGISDGACSLLIMSEEKSKSLGYEPLGYIRGWKFVGLEPERMGLGPVFAINSLLKKAGLRIDDIDLIELNEAFAAQYLACERELKLSREKVNVNGGAIALGHPVGMTGARLVLTLLNELKRRNLKLGISALCIGGGQGGAVLVERF